MSKFMIVGSGHAIQYAIASTPLQSTSVAEWGATVEARHKIEEFAWTMTPKERVRHLTSNEQRILQEAFQASVVFLD